MACEAASIGRRGWHMIGSVGWHMILRHLSQYQTLRLVGEVCRAWREATGYIHRLRMSCDASCDDISRIKLLQRCQDSLTSLQLRLNTRSLAAGSALGIQRALVSLSLWMTELPVDLDANLRMLLHRCAVLRLFEIACSDLDQLFSEQAGVLAALRAHSAIKSLSFRLVPAIDAETHASRSTKREVSVSNASFRKLVAALPAQCKSLSLVGPRYGASEDSMEDPEESVYAQLKQLETLTLCGDSVRPTCSIATVLKWCHVLKSLDLSGNDLRDQGITGDTCNAPSVPCNL